MRHPGLFRALERCLQDAEFLAASARASGVRGGMPRGAATRPSAPSPAVLPPRTGPRVPLCLVAQLPSSPRSVRKGTPTFLNCYCLLI